MPTWGLHGHKDSHGLPNRPCAGTCGSRALVEYIAIVKTYKEAYAHATRLAEEAGRNAWFHKHGDDYEPLNKPHN